MDARVGWKGLDLGYAIYRIRMVRIMLWANRNWIVLTLLGVVDIERGWIELCLMMD